jgi:hypothetical protein
MIGRKPKSPLTNHFGENFGGSKPRRKRVFIGAALLLIVPYIGSTLAASVTITGRGGSTAIEFGQGNQVAITCDTSITTTINESWHSTSNAFSVGSIVLSDVNVASDTATTANNGGCGGKIMTISLYSGAAGSATPTVIGNGAVTSVSFTVPTANGTNAFTVNDNVTNGITASSTISSNNGTLTITLPAGVVTAANITRVSIETDNPS